MQIKLSKSYKQIKPRKINRSVKEQRLNKTFHPRVSQPLYFHIFLQMGFITSVQTSKCYCIFEWIFQDFKVGFQNSEKNKRPRELRCNTSFQFIIRPMNILYNREEILENTFHVFDDRISSVVTQKQPYYKISNIQTIQENIY